MKNSEKIKQIADKVIDKLLEHDVIIQRYNSYSTSSIYLKFDFGLANTLRIADHTGKKHLNYMFNIGCDVKHRRTERKDFTRYYYPASMVTEAVGHILTHRERKISRYVNFDAYLEAVLQTKESNAGRRGFWEQAYVVDPAYRELNKAMGI